MIVVTGAESSGTGYVAALLRANGAEVLHRAMPHHDGEREVWWDVDAFPADTQFMIVVRMPFAQLGSRRGQGDVHGPAKRRMAYEALLGRMGIRSWEIVTYEGLRLRSARKAFVRDVVGDRTFVDVPFKDGNSKYLGGGR